MSKHTLIFILLILLGGCGEIDRRGETFSGKLKDEVGEPPGAKLLKVYDISDTDLSDLSNDGSNLYVLSDGGSGNRKILKLDSSTKTTSTYCVIPDNLGYTGLAFGNNVFWLKGSGRARPTLR